MKMKKVVILALLSAILLGGCMNKEKVTSEKDGIGIELLDIKTKENGKTGNTIIELNTRITNNSEKNISSVKYCLHVLDKEGNLLNSYYKTYYGEDKSIDPGQSVDDYFGFQDKFEGKPASFELEIVEVKDTEEEPLIHLPLPDEYLYEAIGLERLKDELPTEIYVRIDHMGALDEAYVTDEETLKELVNRFCIVKIDQPTDTFVTDNYNGVGFTFADGTQRWVSFNLYNLEFGSHGKTYMYELKDLGSFWSMCVELTSSEE